MKLLALTSVGCLLLVGSAEASISFVASTAQSGFGSLAVYEDFEGVSPKDAALSSFTSGVVTYTGETGSNVFVSSPGYANYGISGSTISSILTSNGDEDYTLTFSQTVKRIGFDTYTIDAAGAPNSVGGAPPVELTVVTTAGTFTHSVVAGPDNQGFVGVVSDEAILSVNWYGRLGGVRNTGIDNVRLSEAVPEPGTMAALGLGLAALGRKRRKA